MLVFPEGHPLTLTNVNRVLLTIYSYTNLDHCAILCLRPVAMSML
jgi:hypothetical protein